MEKERKQMEIVQNETKLEEMEFLKLSESSLAEWNSEEDDVYNDL